jgi:hypothetical protein
MAAAASASASAPAPATANADGDVYRLSLGIHTRLSAPECDPLAVKAHQSAVTRMQRLRDIMLQKRRRGEVLDNDSRMLLLFAGISVARRVNLQNRDSQEASDLGVTLALLFVLQVLCKQRADADNGPMDGPLDGEGGDDPVDGGGDPVDDGGFGEDGDGDGDGSVGGSDGSADDGVGRAPANAAADADADAETEAERILKRWRSLSLIEQMHFRDKCEEMRKEAENNTYLKRKLAKMTETTPDDVCRACILHADSSSFSSRLSTEVTLADVVDASTLFFQCSGLSIAYELLQTTDDDTAKRGQKRKDTGDFLTLSSVELVAAANEDNERESLLQTIVEAAEAEVGQQVLRDFILSFTLPQHIVGVRRGPLLGREANRLATETCTELINDAHDAAMRGAEFTWASDGNETNRMCALLAGLSLILSRKQIEHDAATGNVQVVGGGGTAVDALRRGDAFGGRVTLPFLSTRTPPADAMRLTLIPHANEWIVFKMDARGKPNVLLKAKGLDGLCTAALLISK